MNHKWQQPIRPLEVNPNNQPGQWYMVLFIKPVEVVSKYLNGVHTPGYTTWLVMSSGGHVYNASNSMLREATR